MFYLQVTNRIISLSFPQQNKVTWFTLRSIGPLQVCTRITFYAWWSICTICSFSPIGTNVAFPSFRSSKLSYITFKSLKFFPSYWKQNRGMRYGKQTIYTKHKELKVFMNLRRPQLLYMLVFNAIPVPWRLGEHYSRISLKSSREALLHL